MARKDARPPARHGFFGRYGLSVILGGLFLASWIGQAITEWVTVSEQARDHGQSPTVGTYLWEFWQSTLENWQSEFLQLLTFVVLTAYFVHLGSAESKDSDEETQATLERIEARLISLERHERSQA